MTIALVSQGFGTASHSPYNKDIKRTDAMRFKINSDQSSSVHSLKVNPITGTARVKWGKATNCEYRCTRVSRRKILALILDSDRSLGRWVNRHAQWKNNHIFSLVNPMYSIRIN